MTQQPFKTEPWMYVPVIFVLMFVMRVLQAFIRASWCWLMVRLGLPSHQVDRGKVCNPHSPALRERPKELPASSHSQPLSR
jgi:hypothetical protein